MTNTRRLLCLMMMVTPLLIAAAATADELVADVDWSTHPPRSGTVVDGAVVLDGPAGVYPLTVLDSLPLSGSDIAMAVDVVVTDVGSPGYLELWAVYADGSRYFSRTFDSAGVGLLRTGVSTTMVLPFGLAGTVPDALELNVVLPDGGRLEIGDVTLTEVGPGSITTNVPGTGDAWWSLEGSGVGGGIAGGLFGVLGALVGVLASRSRARRFVTGMLFGGVALGTMAVMAGVVALGVGQPYHVWFPLLLLGSILGAVFGANARVVPARYEAMELQRIRAHDLS